MSSLDERVAVRRTRIKMTTPATHLEASVTAWQDEARALDTRCTALEAALREIVAAEYRMAATVPDDLNNEFGVAESFAYGGMDIAMAAARALLNGATE